MTKGEFDKLITEREELDRLELESLKASFTLTQLLPAPGTCACCNGLSWLLMLDGEFQAMLKRHYGL